MTLPVSPSSLFRLDGFDLIVCQGADAEAFLQAQLSNDIRELGVRNTQWNALLNPQGRVLALMLLVKISATELIVAVAHHRGAALVEALKKFVLRRKLTLSLDTCRNLYGAAVRTEREGLILLDLPMADGRALYLGTSGLPCVSVAAHWRLQDLQAGIPWLPAAAAERHLPHALALDKLPAISLKKGCYPGQEIVARTHYLGRNKRVLCLLRAESNGTAIVPGAQVRDSNQQLAGELIDAVSSVDGTFALAVISDGQSNLPLFAQRPDSSVLVMHLAKRF